MTLPRLRTLRYARSAAAASPGASAASLGVQLPRRASRRRARACCSAFPDAREAPPPPDVQRALDGIVALLARRGERSRRVALDMERRAAVPPPRLRGGAHAFRPGATLSYGEIAARLGAPGSARAVGQALGRNPFAIVVPCHRVLAAGGKVGGFSANGGIATKLRLLAIEGAARPGRSRALRRRRRVSASIRARRSRTCARRPGAGARHRRRRPVSACELKKTPSIFVALAEAIVYQQLTGKAAATIFARVCALFPRAHEGPTRRADPARLGREAARRRAVAREARSRCAISRAGRRPARSRRWPRCARMDDEAIVERLTQVRGIGRWTVEMLLIFRLGRPDVLPVDDYGIRKGFARRLQEARAAGAARTLEKRGERWRPYRTRRELVPVARARARAELARGARSAGPAARLRRHACARAARGAAVSRSRPPGCSRRWRA